jgi:steroid delta-isomerase-like uncharacterized protein
MVKGTIRMLNDYVAVWNTHDADMIAVFLADNYVYEDMNFGLENKNREELVANINETVLRYPIQMKIVIAIFGTKSRACMSWKWSGTDDYFDETIRSSGVTIFQVTKGKISRETCYQNMGPIISWIHDNILLVEGILEEEHYECPKQRAVVKKIDQILGKLDYTGPIK